MIVFYTNPNFYKAIFAGQTFFAKKHHLKKVKEPSPRAFGGEIVCQSRLLPGCPAGKSSHALCFEVLVSFPYWDVHGTS